MAKKMKLLERIDEVTASSITPEEYEKIWGVSLEEQVDAMMEKIHELESEKKPAVKTTTTRTFHKVALPPAAKPAAAAAAMPDLGVKILSDSPALKRAKPNVAKEAKRARGPKGGSKGNMK